MTLAAVVAAAIAAAALALGALSPSGAVGAFGVGAVTFGLGGLTPAALLVLFFVSSSALSRLGGSRKREVAAAFSKGHRRDLGQVLANGSAAAGASVLYGLTSSELWLAAVVGALAAANADTWATELGVLSRQMPRLITSGERVKPGTSGAVSLVGTLAAAAGGVLIGGAAFWLERQPVLLLAGMLGGLGGALLDSVLGATVQAMYFCPTCQRATERHPRHSCGSSTQPLRGLPWLNNDAVNLAATLTGSLLAWLLVLVFPFSG